jgi:tetratricopeptide (TPR) repeat protein
MNKVNQDKITDFNQWALLSFDHFENVRYADALTNMRKSGEAACKIILTFYKSKSDFSKRAFKELLSLIEKDNVIPKKIFNCLQTFQLYGNTASHDNEISAKEAGYGIEALKIITDWIYVELLNEPIPYQLKKYLFVKDTTEKLKLKSEVKQLNEELHNIKKVTENLENKLNLAGATELEKNKLNDDLKEAFLTIKKLETTISNNKRIEELESKAKEITETTDPFPLNHLPIEKKLEKTNGKKIIILSIILIPLIFVIYYFLSTKPIAKIQETSNIAADDTSQIKVLILPFRITQDNPNIDFKIETIIVEKLSVRQENGKSALKIIYNPKKDKSAMSFQQATGINKIYNADVILFGDVIENADGNGFKLNFSYTIFSISNNQNYYGSLPLMEFNSSDNYTYNDLLNEINCIIDLGEVSNKIDQNKLQDALNLLRNTNSKNNDLRIIASTLEFNSYINSGEIDKGREVIYNLYVSNPKKMGVMLSYAYSLTLQNTNLEAAEKVYKDVLEIFPTNTEAILCYANTLVNFKKISEAKSLYNRIIKIDSNNSEAYYQLGEIAEKIDQNSLTAKNFYITSLEKNDQFFPSLKGLSIVFFNMRDYENSILYAKKYIKFIKDDPEIYTFISQIYQSTALLNQDSTQKYLLLSKKYGSKESVGNLISEANLAYQKRDFLKAKPLYLKAYEMDSSINTTEPMMNLVDIYMVENNIPAAEKILLHYHNLDTTYVRILSMLGRTYAFPNNPNMNDKKALQYGLKALRLQPSNEMALIGCAELYFLAEDFKNAEKYFTSAYNVNPKGYPQNFYLGIINKNNKEFIKAKTFFENAIQIDPNNPSPYIDLGFVLIWPPYQDYEYALQQTAKAIELNPNEYSAFYVTAIIYKQQGNREESIKFLNLAKEKTNLLEGIEYLNL